jgi:hypothetical protein
MLFNQRCKSACPLPFQGHMIRRHSRSYASCILLDTLPPERLARALLRWPQAWPLFFDCLFFTPAPLLMCTVGTVYDIQRRSIGRHSTRNRHLSTNEKRGAFAPRWFLLVSGSTYELIIVISSPMSNGLLTTALIVLCSPASATSSARFRLPERRMTGGMTYRPSICCSISMPLPPGSL